MISDNYDDKIQNHIFNPSDELNEVQIVNTVLSVDPDNSPELTAMFASSLATSISKECANVSPGQNKRMFPDK